MRQFFRMLLLALVLMTVALISALTAMQLAIHGREVTIPKLVGMSPLEAERAGAASGLLVGIERQFYSADLPEGKIMTQMPPPGTTVTRGSSSRAGARRATIRASYAICDLRARRSQHDRDPDSGARTENCGGQRSEFRSALVFACGEPGVPARPPHRSTRETPIAIGYLRSIIAAKNPSQGCTPGIVLR